MIVQVKLFAVARQVARQDRVEVDLPDGSTVSQLREEIVRQIPSLGPLMPHLMFAVDAQYADDDKQIQPDAEIVCIPPVSGG